MNVRPLLALLCFVALAARADDAPALPDRLIELLDECGLDHSIDDDGEARLLIDTGDDRDQLVWVRTDLTPLGDASLFHVYSFSHQSKQPVPRDRAAKLLQENPRLILGAWSLRHEPDGDEWKWRVVFSAELPDSVDAGQFKTALLSVAASADRMEREWTDTDRF